MKAFYTRFLFLALIIIAFAGCKKDLTYDNNGLNHVPDFETRVTASVSGFVTNDNGEPVEGAQVTAGSITVTTDEYGYFKVSNVLLRKEVAVVRVKHAGYFNGIRSFIAEDGKSTFVRIQILSKTNAGSIDASAGGAVSLTNGMGVSLPASAVTLNGAAYTGQVNVFAKWIDPTSPSLSEQMPGDLRAVNTEGYMRMLETYGMMAVELETPGGEKLEVAAGKKASVTFPLPTSLMASAPNTIPLWHFNEETGLWVEEGSAGKVGSSYVGEVSHFSFWNCDIPMEYVQFSVTLLNTDGNPLPYTRVELSVVDNPNMKSYGITDSTGFVGGIVPANRQLNMAINTSISCYLQVQQVNVGSTNVNLGNVVISSTLSNANITGTVTDCNGQALQSGTVMVYYEHRYYSYPVQNGSYSFNVVNCGDPTYAVINAYTSSSTGDTLGFTFYPGSNSVPPIGSCDFQLSRYDGKYTLRGIHNRPGYQYLYETDMDMITTAANKVIFFFNAAGSPGHPIAIDSTGVLSWYGPTVSPQIVFDLSTNTVTDVFNTSPDGPPMSLYSGPVATTNYYDPVAKKIYVAFMYNNNPDRAFFDTLTYIGPR